MPTLFAGFLWFQLLQNWALTIAMKGVNVPIIQKFIEQPNRDGFIIEL